MDIVKILETPTVQELARRLENGGVLSCGGVDGAAHGFLLAALGRCMPTHTVVGVTAGLKAQEGLQQDLETWLEVLGLFLRRRLQGGRGQLAGGGAGRGQCIRLEMEAGYPRSGAGLGIGWSQCSGRHCMLLHSHRVHGPRSPAVVANAALVSIV